MGVNSQRLANSLRVAVRCAMKEATAKIRDLRLAFSIDIPGPLCRGAPRIVAADRPRPPRASAGGKSSGTRRGAKTNLT